MVRSDPPSEDEIKRSAELREWLEERIAELETELARLKDMQSVVDSVLRKTSFVPASESTGKHRRACGSSPTREASGGGKNTGACNSSR